MVGAIVGCRGPYTDGWCHRWLLWPHGWLVCIRFDLPIHAAPAPNDGGLTMGGVWHVTPPPDRGTEVAMLGLELWDSQDVAMYAAGWLAEVTDVAEIARLLLDGSIVAVMRGRQEVGPRALGHRSLLAYGANATLKDSMNEIKARKWWRPVAPVVLLEAVERYFEVPSDESYTSP